MRRLVHVTFAMAAAAALLVPLGCGDSAGSQSPDDLKAAHEKLEAEHKALDEAFLKLKGDHGAWVAEHDKKIISATAAPDLDHDYLEQEHRKLIESHAKLLTEHEKLVREHAATVESHKGKDEATVRADHKRLAEEHARMKADHEKIAKDFERIKSDHEKMLRAH